MNTDPKPIDWHDVALVGFCNGKPVVITSVEPSVLFGACADIAREVLGEVDDEDLDSEWYDQISVSDALRDISGYRWELYSTEDAKKVFCAGQEDKTDEKPPSNKPLPGQLTLPIPE